MNFAKSDYPIGARWECEQKGRYGYIELHSRNGIEQWYYGWSYGDGSGHQFDWSTSYQSARRNHWVWGRYKRVK